MPGHQAPVRRASTPWACPLSAPARGLGGDAGPAALPVGAEELDQDGGDDLGWCVVIVSVEHLEPRGVVEVTGVPLKATVIQGKEVPQLIDELPILSIAAVLASGKTTIRHAEELRVKETDRIAAIAHNLRTMGAQVAELSDGLEIYGPAPLHGARLPSFGDHRIAMAFAVAGLFAEGETIIQDAECIRESYPGFEAVLEEFTNPKRMQVSTPVIGSLAPVPAQEG